MNIKLILFSSLNCRRVILILVLLIHHFSFPIMLVIAGKTQVIAIPCNDELVDTTYSDDSL